MRGKARYWLAAGFAALFVLLFFQKPDHDYLAFLRTKSWLMDEDNSPFATVPPFRAVVGGETVQRPVALSVTISPESRRDQYERIGREWNRGNEIDSGEPVQARLSVRVGDNGFESILAFPGADPNQPVRLRLFRAPPPEPINQEVQDEDLGYYPDGWSLLPPFLAIILAILTAKVIPSLLLGCLAGAMVYTAGPVAGGLHLLEATIWQRTLGDDFRLSITGFVIFLFMAVGVMARSGGIQGMVEWVRRFARGPTSTQMCSFVIGILIFFDDYTNCILTGTTMRPLADKNRLSREKLSYIVDSTAAPIAGISIFSTWIAYEMSMFKDQLPEVTKTVVDATGNEVQVPYQQSEAFTVFLQTIPIRFYCLFTLAMVLLTIVMRREFGPMLTAEQRARSTGKPVADDAKPMISKGLSELEAPDNVPHLARNALLPVGMLVAVTLALIYVFGYQGATQGGESLPSELGPHIRAILSNTASERALFWASLVALVVAAALVLSQRILTLAQTLGSALRSAQSLIFALVILILAWGIGHTCTDLGTADFLTTTLQRGLEPWLLPMLMFALAALVSFSTGTSYGTMAILLPNVVVLAHTMGETDPNMGGPALMILTIGAVLEGSIFGDHCSPISDTTVLSSVATSSDHLHHVRTQAPYAVFVMIVAMILGYLPVAIISPHLWPVSLGLGIGAIAIALLLIGRNPETNAPAKA